MAPSPRGISMWMQLVVLLGMVAGAMSTAENREAKGFSDSGYMWPKTMLWKGMRSSPGSLWLFYAVFLTAASLCAAVSALMAFPSLVPRIRLQRWMNSPAQKSAWHGGFVGGAEYLLAGGLLFVGLGVTQLSHVVEVYLAGMTTIQLLFTGLVFEAGSSSSGMWNTLFGFELGAVLGIALLDSYRPLNVLNAVYSTVGVIGLARSTLCASIAFKNSRKKRGRWNMLAVLGHVGFSIAAYLVADEVEGVHRRPMLALLCTACFFTVVIFFLQNHIDSTARKAWQGIE